MRSKRVGDSSHRPFCMGAGGERGTVSGPDNIARLIGASAALVSAANMAVSYATYKRKRPRLSVTHSGSTLISATPGGRTLHVRRSVELVLENRGETEVRIRDAVLWARVVPERRALGPWAKYSTLVGCEWLSFPEKSNAHPLASPDITEFPIRLTGFRDEMVSLRLPECLAAWGSPSGPVKYRVAVSMLTGRSIYTEWCRLPESWLPCCCPTCERDGAQLSFDDVQQGD